MKSTQFVTAPVAFSGKPYTGQTHVVVTVDPNGGHFFAWDNSYDAPAVAVMVGVTLFFGVVFGLLLAWRYRR